MLELDVFARQSPYSSPGACCAVEPALSGPDFVRTYVIFEVAHRYGDEMLLWDGWAATQDPSEVDLVDELARLLARTPGTAPPRPT